MTPQTPEQIAGKLTKAQRAALLWCNEDGTPRAHTKGAETSFYCMAKAIKGDPEKEVATIYSLVKRGQSQTEKRGIWPTPTWALTPLGLQVRAILRGEA